MNIADRSQANRAGWETRRKRMAAEMEKAIDLEVLTRGAQMIRTWANYRLQNKKALKDWEGGPPLGHDSPPQIAIVRVRRPIQALPVPEDYLTVETSREAAGFVSEAGAKKLELYGTIVHAYTGNKWIGLVVRFQDNLGSM